MVGLETARPFVSERLFFDELLCGAPRGRAEHICLLPIVFETTLGLDDDARRGTVFVPVRWTRPISAFSGQTLACNIHAL